MSVTIPNPVELRRRGFEALVHALGWVDAVRFLHQYESSTHDYTVERHKILPDWDAATMVSEACKLKGSVPHS